MTQRISTTIFAICVIVAPLMAQAAGGSSGITYQGRIVKPDGRPLDGSNVQFRLQIRTPGAENCLMYEEMQSRDMRNSSGIFALTINDGNGLRADSTGMPLDRIFANIGSLSFAASSCNGSTTYTPSTSDGRRFVVYFKDETMGDWEALPPQNINYVPFAINTKQVGSFGPDSLLRVQNTDGSVGTATALTQQNFVDLLAIVNGTTNQYVRRSSNGTSVLPGFANTTPPTMPAPGQMWYDTTSNTVKYFNGVSTQTIGTATGTGSVTSVAVSPNLTVNGTAAGTITTTGTIDLANTGVAAGSYAKVTVDAKGRVTAGGSLVEGDVPTLSAPGKVSGNAITSGTIGGSTAVNTTGNILTTGYVSAGTISATGSLVGGSLAVTGNATIGGTSTVGGVASAGSFQSQQFRVYETSNSFRVTVVAPSTMTGDYQLTLPQAAPVANGMVLASDTAGNLTWIAPSTGSVTSVTGNAPITVGGTAAAPVISVTAATTGALGVVQLAASGDATAGRAVQANDARLSDSRAPSGAAGGDLTGTYPNPTLATSGVTAGTFGTATSVPSFVVDTKGRLTSASNTAISFPVLSVAGRTGAVTLNYGDILNGAGAYLTDQPNNTA